MKTPQNFRLWFVLGVVSWLAFGFLVWCWNSWNSTHFFPQGHEEVYHFATSFEAFHALVDGLALICLLFTVWQQRDELHHLQKTVELQGFQAELQGFQNNFFNY